MIGIILTCISPGNVLGYFPEISLPRPPVAKPPADTYRPTAQVLKFVSDVSMTPHAREIFLAAKPVVDTDRHTFDQHCTTPLSGKAVELGCYTSDNRIYILNISSPELSPEMAVIAAHEMLHAAWANLPVAEVEALTPLLEGEVTRPRGENLAKELVGYGVIVPVQRVNELHSILGTEFGEVGPKLEQYYRRYFMDRRPVVETARKFKAVFVQLQDTLAALKTEIGQTRANMDVARGRGEIVKYNSLVLHLNSTVKQYNDLVAQYNALSKGLLGKP
jgi:hypothetical protein